MTVLQRSTNHFELFGLQSGFDIDGRAVEDRYHKLQALLHPDRYASAGDLEQRLAVQKSASVNEAYGILTDPCARAAYLLELQGIEFKAETGTAKDVEFLAGQMELRERLEQAQQHAAAAEVTALADEVARTTGEVHACFARAYRDGALDDARELVLKMQFLKKTSATVHAVARQLEQEEAAG